MKSKMLIPVTIGFLMASGSFALAEALPKDQTPQGKHRSVSKSNLRISVAWRQERHPSSSRTAHYLVYGINGI